MTATRTADVEPPCPKCASPMLHVAMTRHPLRPTMQRNTFVCYACNQTRTYMLPIGDDNPTAARTA